MNYQVGDVVWVRTASGVSHEEPAAILKLNCPLDESDYSDDAEEKKQSSEATENGKKKNDTGIMIRLTVNNTHMVVPENQVRPLMDKIKEEEENADGKEPAPRRSARRSRRLVETPRSSRHFQVKNEGDNNGGAKVTVKPSKRIKEEKPMIVKSESTATDMVVVIKQMDRPSTNESRDNDDVDNSDDDLQLATVRRSTRRKAAISTTVSNRKRKLPEDEQDEKEVTTKKVARTRSTRKKVAVKTESNSTTSDTTTTKSKTTITDKPSQKKKKASPKVAVKTESNNSTTTKSKTKSTNKTSKKKKKASPKAKCIIINNSDSESDPSFIPGQPDGNGGLFDNPDFKTAKRTSDSDDNSSDSDDDDAEFTVEYSKTSRAACKRCDVRIEKGEIRISHSPLFRGKPGFRVFKHLKCAIFSEDVTCATNIGGYRKLQKKSMKDYEALVKRVEDSRKEIQKENEELQPDELVQVKFEGEERCTPEGLTANLLPFQKEGLSWMYHQEKVVEDVRGGILADEMGMGKTLQTISVSLDNRPQLQTSIPGAKYPPSCTTDEVTELEKEESLWDKSLLEWEHEMKMNEIPKSMIPKASQKSKGEPTAGARAGTLVICPVIALTQWKKEIEKFCEPGTVSVKIYHGPNRAKDCPRTLLQKYDFVLTTYQVLEGDFRKMVSPNRIKCPNCNRKFKIDKLAVHLKYFCGEGATRTEAQARQRRSSNQSNNQSGSRGNSSGSRSTKQDNSKTKKTPTKDSSMEKPELEPVKSRSSSSRKAASQAKGRLSAVAKKSGANTDDEDDDYSGGSDTDTDDESDDYSDNPKRKKGWYLKKKAPAKKQNTKRKRALAKQADALNQLKSKKGKNGKKLKKVFPKGIKKKGPVSSDESSSEDEASDMEIDMDALIKEAMSGAQFSVLHSFCWWRIVLDEAHMIKSRSSNTAQAAFALIGVHRWCLSGTPLQNRVGEFYSLVRFLRLDPMAHYVCRHKGCNCKQIHYRMMNGKCKDCGHGSVQHYSHFNKHILNPIQRDGYSHDGRRAMFVLKNEILDKCLLRRTKETRAEDMNLPPRLVTIKAVRLHPIEEDFYNALYTQTRSSFDDYVEDGTLLNNYAHIFDLLMRMRQSVSHPYLVLHSKKNENKTNSDRTVFNGTAECELCHEPPVNRVVSSCCQTAFCKSCVLEYMETSAGAGAAENSTSCPHCRNPFSIDLNQVVEDVVDDGNLSFSGKAAAAVSRLGLPSLKELKNVSSGSILRKIDLTQFATSTKIEALTKELVQMRQTSPGSKAIVFSQFVNMLDLIRWRLHSDPYLSEMGLGARALHGGMDVKARDTVLSEFQTDPTCRVLLMSLKAGGVALNLTVSNFVFLMDPWWNPAAEMQAIDRTHRLGQYRPIKAVRFIAENTVEERILQLQEKKRLVFDGTVGRDAGSLKMLTVDDMKSLFA